MDPGNPKALFTRFWWKRLYQRYRKTRSTKKRKHLRKEMRQTARNLIEMITEKTA